MERIALTRVDIDNATSRVAKGLAQYCWLQVNRDTRDVRSDPEYRRRFNHFYRVRRGKEWQDSFYGILESKKGKRVTFAEVLHELYRATSRYEASFASKLLATLDPEMPVIDSVVLRNLGLRLPAWTSPNRAERICAIHQTMLYRFKEFLTTESGTYLLQRFRSAYPDAGITEIKMLDFILWQTRL